MANLIINKQYIFILVIILIFICVNIEKEIFIANKYNIILIDHKKYLIIIIKNTNNTNKKIYKIYKN